MTDYRVEIMTNDNANRMFMGNFFTSDIIIVTAETKEDAIAKAETENKGYYVRVETVETVEQYNKREQEFDEWAKKEKEKRERTKARKAELEREKAEALGLTVEQFRKKVKKEKKIKDTKKRIAELERLLKEEKENLKRLEK